MKTITPNEKGFTLIEIMVVVLIVAIFAAIAIPSYQEYKRRALATQAQDQIQQIAIELEKHKTRNFNYLGFSLPNHLSVLPRGGAGSNIKYNFMVTGDAGRTWIIRAQSTDPKNFNFLITSTGIRCKNKTWVNITGTTANNMTCGVGQEEW